MPVKLGEAYVLIEGKLKLKDSLTEAQRQIAVATGQMEAEVSKGLEKVETKTKSLFDRLKGVATFAAMVYGIKRTTEAAMEQAEAESQLATALGGSGKASGKAFEEMKQYAGQMQKVTVHEDEVVMAGMALAKNLGVQTKELKQGTKAAIGLAHITGMTLPNAFKVIGRASQGNTTLLANWGIQIDKAGTKAEKFAQVLALGEAGFKKAERYARSSAGQLTQLGNAWSTLQEKIGKFFLTIARVVEPGAKALLNVLNAIPGPIYAAAAAFAATLMGWGRIIAVLKGVAAAYRAIASGAALAGLMQAVATPVGWVKLGAAIVAATAAWVLFNKAMAEGVKADEEAARAGESAAKGAEGRANALTNLVTQTTGLTSATQKAGKADELPEKAKAMAEAIMERVKAKRAEALADEERQKAMIGWDAISELWKKGMVAGQMERFAQKTYQHPGQWGGAEGKTWYGTPPGTEERGEPQVSAREMERAFVEIVQEQREETGLMRQLVHLTEALLRRGVVEF